MTAGSYTRIPPALRTPREEYVDAGTHAFGFIMSLVGGGVLLPAAWRSGDPYCFLGCVIYVCSMAITFFASAMSHVYLSFRLNKFFRKLDQAVIYLMIVGTFSPFALTFLRTPLWLTFYGLAVVISLYGFVSKMMLEHRLDGVSVWLYVTLGITQGVALFPLMQVLPVGSIIAIVLGGLCYLIGTYFLMKDLRRYHFHTIWHLLVLAGSAVHFAAVWLAIPQLKA